MLTIPVGSPLMDRHVTIGTDANGGLSVFYAGDQPGSFCGVSRLKVSPRAEPFGHTMPSPPTRYLAGSEALVHADRHRLVFWGKRDRCVMPFTRDRR